MADFGRCASMILLPRQGASGRLHSSNAQSPIMVDGAPRRRCMEESVTPQTVSSPIATRRGPCRNR